MQPEQIKKAITELFEMTQKDSRPASETINQYTRSRRYIGSKDRKLLTEGVYLLWRQKGCPNWWKEIIPNAEAHIAAMNTPAPTILRATGNRDEVIAILKEQGIQAVPTKLSPFGICLDKRYNLQGLELFRQGRIEIQDEGSQLIALACQVQKGERILDMCAGAGGKSLAFAQIMQNDGFILAHDISARSLSELEKRASRAKISIIHTTTKLPNQLFDRVICDVPCSGSGTWRRCPDLKWKMTPAQFEKICNTQVEILNQAATLVRSGGQLCYLTCSLTYVENEERIDNFLKLHSNFKLLEMQHFSPLETQTDGFFIARLERS